MAVLTRYWVGCGCRPVREATGYVCKFGIVMAVVGMAVWIALLATYHDVGQLLIKYFDGYYEGAQLITWMFGCDHLENIDSPCFGMEHVLYGATASCAVLIVGYAVGLYVIKQPESDLSKKNSLLVTIACQLIASSISVSLLIAHGALYVSIYDEALGAVGSLYFTNIFYYIALTEIVIALIALPVVIYEIACVYSVYQNMRDGVVLDSEGGTVAMGKVDLAAAGSTQVTVDNHQQQDYQPQQPYNPGSKNDSGAP